MNQRDYEKAIEREVEEWPGASVSFTAGGKHPKAKLVFDGKMLSHPYPSTPSDAVHGIHNMLGDIRRTLKKLGAARTKPEPTKEEDEAPYQKPNEGRAKRPDPAAGPKTTPKPDVADQLVEVGAATKAQAKAAKGDPSELFDGPVKFVATDADEAIRAEFLARVDGIVDGIYFELPADVYHAVPRLSSSGIQKLCVSPATFWAGSWLDPDRPTEEESETIWRLLGRAYHCARLEPELFPALFVRELSKADYPKETLFTGVQMGKALEDIGLKKTGSVAEQAQRLDEYGYPHPIWPIELAKWEAERNGRTAIPAKNYDAMVTDMERIHKNGPIAKLLSDGQAEVSIFWTDQHGIKMKSRLDYLTPTHISDFKTMDNSKGKNFEQALADAVRYNRYYLQAAVYRDAVEAIRMEGLQVIEARTDAQRELVAKIQIKPGELDFWFVFQEKSGVPNLVAREYPFYSVPYSTLFNEQITSDEGRRAAVREATKQRTQIHTLAQSEVLNAKKMFVLYSEVYPAGEPWFPLEPMGRFSDESWHPYWLSGELR